MNAGIQDGHPRRRRTKLILGVVACLSTLLLASACRRSEHQQSVRPEAEEQQTYRQKALDLLEHMKAQPGYRESEDARLFLLDLLQSGRLPGAEHAEPGTMLGNPEAIHVQPTNYPMSRVFVGQRKAEGPWENHYLMVKRSAGEPWRLERAWRTDESGKTGQLP